MITLKSAINMWKKEYGSNEKVRDFSGRTMAKGGYNKIDSRYGWTVICILPENRGGDFYSGNTICCSIKTAREKGQDYPFFKANNQFFTIKKVRNEYRILTDYGENQCLNEGENIKAVDFKNGKEGITYWNTCEKRKKEFFVGYVRIKAEFERPDTLLFEKVHNFIENILCIPVFKKIQSDYRTGEFFFINFEMNSRRETEDLFEKCLLLNTYSKWFFSEEAGIHLHIYYGMNFYNTEKEINRENLKNDIFDKKITYSERFAIDNLVKKNIILKDNQILNKSEDGFYGLNMTLKKTKEEIKKLTNM